MKEQIGMMIQQICTPEAVERLARVELVKKEQVQALKMSIIDMARKGELREKITEEKLIQMLEQVPLPCLPACLPAC